MIYRFNLIIVIIGFVTIFIGILIIIGIDKEFIQIGTIPKAIAIPIVIMTMTMGFSILDKCLEKWGNSVGGTSDTSTGGGPYADTGNDGNGGDGG